MGVALLENGDPAYDEIPADGLDNLYDEIHPCSCQTLPAQLDTGECVCILYLCGVQIHEFQNFTYKSINTSHFLSAYISFKQVLYIRT